MLFPSVAPAADPESVALVVLAADPGALALRGDPWLVSGEALSTAVTRLRAAPDLARVSIAIVPAGSPSAADRALLSAARVVIALSPDETSLRMLRTPVGGADETRQVQYLVANPQSKVQTTGSMIRDASLDAYARAGGSINIERMIARVVARHFGVDAAAGPPLQLSTSGIWDPRTGEVHEAFDTYAAAYLTRNRGARDRRWVALLAGPSDVRDGRGAIFAAAMTEIERRGFNALTLFGAPSAIDRFLLSPPLDKRLAAMILMTREGLDPMALAPMLLKLDVPLLNAIRLRDQDHASWYQSPAGIAPAERFHQFYGPERIGAIAPTVVSVQGSATHAGSRFAFRNEQPVPERIVRLVDRAARLAELRFEENVNKRIAIIHYNDPPGPPAATQIPPPVAGSNSPT